MPPQITVKQAGGWAAWVKLTGWVDPGPWSERQHARRADEQRKAFQLGSYAAAVRYYSRFIDRRGKPRGRVD